ncbi:MAG TPA: phosphoglucosamine mutase [Vicinamibacteria bacterium]|nr:phosphoglucosamine mutase [Vicinamibacteria bacterium]
MKPDMPRLFGTDGIRGRAGEFPLDPPTVQKIGRAVVRALGAVSPRVLIGRDTRESGAELEAHLAAGLAAEGAVVESAGVIPTPAIAHLARGREGGKRQGGYQLGIVISASHNPYEDNGIKVFGGAGRKFSTELEERTEDLVDRIDHATLAPAAPAARDLTEAYLGHLARAYEGRRLEGRHLVVDCANGATSFLARQLFEGLGARVTVIHDRPDGRNINRGCGATAPGDLARTVVDARASLGVAFDGDGDRAIFADEAGKVVDGDHVLFLAGRQLHSAGRLKGGAVVATVMSNIGLELALGKLGIPLVRTAVGDRNVLEEMERRGANLGGEQSGHVIFLDNHTTGDGMLTALKLLEVIVGTGRSLRELASELPVYPQVLLNVRVREKRDIETLPEVKEALDRARAALDGRGRLVVRYSGTEPLLRVMAEGPDENEIRELAEAIVRPVKDQLGA